MIRAIIFDCFGVIITDALEAVLEGIEVGQPEARQYITDIIHANNLGMVDPSESNRRIADYLNISEQEWRTKIDQGEVKDERVLAWIRELRKDYKTALLSNIGRGSMNRRFTEDELRTHFDAVIISGDVGIAKPDVAIYDYAAQQLDVTPEECVFLDDREGHCDGANHAGMQTILFQNFSQAKADLEALLSKN